MVTTPMLPPVAVPYDDGDGSQFQLQLGDLHVAIYNGEISESSRYMELYVSATAPLTLDATTGSSIALEVGEPVVHVDVSYTSPDYGATDEDTEVLFGDLMPLYLPEITGALGEIPLPEIEGFGLEDVTATMDGGGSEPAYWVLSGSLE